MMCCESVVIMIMIVWRCVHYIDGDGNGEDDCCDDPNGDSVLL